MDTGIDLQLVLAYIGSAVSIGFTAGLWVGGLRAQEKRIDNLVETMGQLHDEEMSFIRENRVAITSLAESGSPGFRYTLETHGDRIRTMEGILREVQSQLNKLERSTIVRMPRRPGEE